MTFWKTVGAYLTGWLIVQPVYNRLVGAYQRRELANPGSASRAWLRAEGETVADVLMERGLGQAKQIRELGERLARVSAERWSEDAVRRVLVEAICEAWDPDEQASAGVIADRIVARGAPRGAQVEGASDG